jgi:hypothetical protein
MAALTADRNTPRRSGEMFDRPVEAATKIFAGGLVCLNAAGNAVPGSVSTTLKAEGRAEYDADNTLGAAGALTVNVRPGIYRWDNSGGGDLIAQADVGNSCYIVDDHTVAKTSGGATRSICGVIRYVDAVGVYVQTGQPVFPI